LTGTALLIGAGKIGRGFLGHLAHRSGYLLNFVDANPDLVGLMQRRRTYRLHILGAPERDESITGFDAVLAGSEASEAAGARADIIFVSVGGPNLRAAGELLGRIAARRSRPVNVIVGENWPDAAAELRGAAASPRWLAIAEATILRSCIEPTEAQRAEDPLALQCQDHWELSVDAAALREPLPHIGGLVPTAHFENELARKVYTYNAINATIAYLGHHRGHRFLADAAGDPVILEHALGVKHEVDETICRSFGYSLDEQQRYSRRAMEKFQNPLIVDPIERQVRDPIRKLGRRDRLVGAAMLTIDAGITPYELALSIAAALEYRNPSDPSAVRLANLVHEAGAAAALAAIAGIEPDGPLASLVVDRSSDLLRLIAERTAS